MKEAVQSVSLVFVVLIVLLSGCAPAPMAVPTSTPIPLTFTPLPIPPTFTPEPTATSVPAPNPFIGYWTQTKLSEHPLGGAVCGNFQNVEFFEDGTFIEISDNSGIYDFMPAMDQKAQGTYNILDEDKVEIKYGDENVTVWKYIFSSDSLTMLSPADESGNEFIPCYFTKSSK